MGLFDKILKKDASICSDDDVVAVCDGKIIETKSIKDEMFAQEMMGKTCAFEPSNDEIVSPVNGTLELVYPTKHAFGVKAKDGTGYLIHIGIDTVNLKGRGFKALKKQGDFVFAGQTVIKADLNEIRKTCPITTMLIVTEPKDGKEYNFKSIGAVNKGDKIN